MTVIQDFAPKFPKVRLREWNSEPRPTWYRGKFDVSAWDPQQPATEPKASTLPPRTVSMFFQELFNVKCCNSPRSHSPEHTSSQVHVGNFGVETPNF